MDDRSQASKSRSMLRVLACWLRKEERKKKKTTGRRMSRFNSHLVRLGSCPSDGGCSGCGRQFSRLFFPPPVGIRWPADLLDSSLVRLHRRGRPRQDGKLHQRLVVLPRPTLIQGGNQHSTDSWSEKKASARVHEEGEEARGSSHEMMWSPWTTGHRAQPSTPPGRHRNWLSPGLISG
jgi:hypothetical protein